MFTHVHTYRQMRRAVPVSSFQAPHTRDHTPQQLITLPSPQAGCNHTHTLTHTYTHKSTQMQIYTYMHTQARTSCIYARRQSISSGLDNVKTRTNTNNTQGVKHTAHPPPVYPWPLAWLAVWVYLSGVSTVSVHQPLQTLHRPSLCHQVSAPPAGIGRQDRVTQHQPTHTVYV